MPRTMQKKRKKNELKERAHAMPAPIPSGEILTDLKKEKFKIKRSIGKGGFGEIYQATPLRKGGKDVVIKVEPRANGPLFCELAFYQRAAQPKSVDEWMEINDLEYLSIPKFITSGCHTMTNGKTEYRFLVMEQFSDNIEKLFNLANRRFNLKTVCYLALRMLEALEYLHNHEYVHADIKGSNILTGFSSSDRHKVYLVDYGLAYRYYCDDQHCSYKPDPKRCHDGTIEFTSIDAHNGLNPTRRGDVEILGYCLLQWMCGKLPWEHCLEDKPQVAELKKQYKNNISKLMTDCFGDDQVPSCLEKYMKCVYKLSYEDEPNYENMKAFFHNEMKSKSMKDDKSDLFWLTGGKEVKVSASHHVIEISSHDESVNESPKPPKRKRPKANKNQELSIDESPKSPKRKKPEALDHDDESPVAKREPKKKSQAIKRALPVIEEDTRSPYMTRSRSRKLDLMSNARAIVNDEGSNDDDGYSDGEVEPSKIDDDPLLYEAANKIIPGHEAINGKRKVRTFEEKIPGAKPNKIQKEYPEEIIPGAETNKIKKIPDIPEGFYPPSLGYN